MCCSKAKMSGASPKLERPVECGGAGAGTGPVSTPSPLLSIDSPHASENSGGAGAGPANCACPLTCPCPPPTATHRPSLPQPPAGPKGTLSALDQRWRAPPRQLCGPMHSNGPARPQRERAPQGSNPLAIRLLPDPAARGVTPPRPGPSSRPAGRLAVPSPVCHALARHPLTGHFSLGATQGRAEWSPAGRISIRLAAVAHSMLPYRV